MHQLTDKVAIITGGGRGIGRETAFSLAREGAKVALAARTVAEIKDTAGQITDAGGTAIAIRTDLTVEDDIKRLVKEAEAALGPTDILINNAGLLKLCHIKDMSAAFWDEMVRVNLRAVFIACREVLPGMIARGSGRIINVGSTAGRRGYEEQSAYCACKHGMIGFSKVLAIETQEFGIRVHVLSPGGVVTELSRQLRESRGGVNDSEWMTSEEVARAVLYLCTQDGAAMTDELVLRRCASDPWR